MHFIFLAIVIIHVDARAVLAAVLDLAQSVVYPLGRKMGVYDASNTARMTYYFFIFPEHATITERKGFKVKFHGMKRLFPYAETD
jgi:hypothetical protein